MDKGLNKAFEKLTEALQFTRDRDVVSIRPCRDTFDGGYVKEVAEIAFRNGSKIYADIGGDANTTAMYDVLAVLCELKPKSKKIQKIEYFPAEPEPAPESAPKKYIEQELENDPSVFGKPRSDEFIDRQTLTHVIGNVNCPEGVDFETFWKVLNAVAEELDCFPYFKKEAPR